VPRAPLPQAEYEEIYAKVPRLTVEVVIVSSDGVLLARRQAGPCQGLWHIAGTVSFRVANMGTLVYELVVLPLPATQIAGNRVPTIDGRVDETGSLGEVSGLPAGEFKVSEMNYNGWNRVDYRIVRNDSAIQGFIYER
jgi:hypothetical protein